MGSPSAAGLPYRVLQVHNEYYSGLGGEDTVVALEFDMLRKHGHAIERLSVSTAELQGASPFKILAAGLSTPWSIRGYELARQAIDRFRPDIVHVHNTFPLLSPSIYWAARSMRVAVVQTLHNYRPVCANGLLMRDGLPCERCIDGSPLSGLRFGCYKDSMAATAPVVAMQLTHRALGTWKSKVDSYITLTDFARKKMIRAGLPEDKIHVKPNFLPDRLLIQQRTRRTRQIVFAGKIIPYKGLDILLEAWQQTRERNARLIILGEGPSRSALQRQHRDSDRIEWRGWADHETTVRTVEACDYLVIPSRALEGLPMVLVEAFCGGTPVIAPAHGAFPELIHPGKDGYLFRPGDAGSLAGILDTALSRDDPQWAEMSANCRQLYEETYTEDANYEILTGIYEHAIRGTERSGQAARP